MSRRSRKKVISKVPVVAEIESFGHDGRGLTHIDGQVTFVDGGLPGERVQLELTAKKRDFAEAKVLQVVKASPLRAEPRCDVYGICGGCSLQHLNAQEQIRVKQENLAEQLKHIGGLDGVAFWPTVTGPLWGYRYKARLGVKYVAKKQRVLVGFRERRNRFLADMQKCEVLHPRVGGHLADFAELIGGLSIRSKIPQIEVCVGDNRCVLVIRTLEQASGDDVEMMRKFSRLHDFELLLQPGGPDRLIPVADYGSQSLYYELPGHGLKLYYEPLQFTQVNDAVNRQLVDRALQLLKPEPQDRVIDLFCGIGNFTLPIARLSASVVGLEGNRALVQQARKNALLNQLENVDFYTADLMQDISGEAWSQNHYDLAMLDPSRSGAAEVLHYFPKWGVKRLLYVSCNPSTLARDAGVLVHQLGYRLSGAGVLDMFPHTSHVESIALFERP